MGQSSELEREIKQKTGGQAGGPARNLGAMAPPDPPLESPPITRRLACHKVTSMHRRTGRRFTGGVEKICTENNNLPSN